MIVRQTPRDSALGRAIQGEDVEWGLSEQLLAVIADGIHAGNWQRGGGKKRDYPKPIPRPGVDDGREKYGKKPIPVDEMAAWLGWV